MAKRIKRFTVTLLCLGTVLVLLEGGLNTWLALYIGGWSIFALYAFASIDDDLAKERFHPPEPGAGDERKLPGGDRADSGQDDLAAVRMSAEEQRD